MLTMANLGYVDDTATIMKTLGLLDLFHPPTSISSLLLLSSFGMVWYGFDIVG